MTKTFKQRIAEKSAVDSDNLRAEALKQYAQAIRMATSSGMTKHMVPVIQAMYTAREQS